MPWHIESGHPGCTGYAVVKDATGEAVGCHPTKQAARKHMAALYANVEDAMAEKEMERRDIALEESRLGVTGDGRTLYGYAAVFDEWSQFFDMRSMQVIREKWQRGAFSRTLSNNGDRVKVLFNHGMDPSVGMKPLGRPSVMREDDHGLYVEVPLDKTSYNEDIIASLRSGALDGMSTTFETHADAWNFETTDGVPERTVIEVGLRELGPVTFPAFEQTLAAVRARQEPADTSARTEPVDTPEDDSGPADTPDAEPVDTSAEERQQTLDAVAQEAEVEAEARTLLLASIALTPPGDEDEQAEDEEEVPAEAEPEEVTA